MDLTAVLPALMEGIAQEVGVDLGELKVILVGDETQLDVKPFQTLREQYHQVEWEFKKIIPALFSRVPYHGTACGSPTQEKCSILSTFPDRLPAIRRQTSKWFMSYQVGTFGSCLSSISRTVWPTQGNFIAKGAPRYYRARLFNGGTHQTIVYPEEWAQSPLPIETFLHIQTWHTR